MYVKELVAKRMAEVQRMEYKIRKAMDDLEKELDGCLVALTDIQEEKKQLEEFLKE